MSDSEFQRGSSLGSVMNQGFLFVGPTRKHEQDAISSSNPYDKDNSNLDVPSHMGNFDETATRQRLNTV